MLDVNVHAGWMSPETRRDFGLNSSVELFKEVVSVYYLERNALRQNAATYVNPD